MGKRYVILKKNVGHIIWDREFDDAVMNEETGNVLKFSTVRKAQESTTKLNLENDDKAGRYVGD